MSDKHLRSPDENFQTVKKDTTREEENSRKNTLRPDSGRPKGEIYADDAEDEEDEEE